MQNCFSDLLRDSIHRFAFDLPHTPLRISHGARPYRRPFDPETGSALLSAKEAASHLGVAVSTLASWRAGRRGCTGPVFVKIGRRVFYRLDDLNAFVDAKRRRHIGSGQVIGGAA